MIIAMWCAALAWVDIAEPPENAVLRRKAENIQISAGGGTVECIEEFVYIGYMVMSSVG